MSYSYTSYFGPPATPVTIKRLVIFTCVVTILSAAIQGIFDQFGVNPGPEDLLSLSRHGISHLFLWQPVSYFFIQESAPYGLSFFFLTSLFFNMYILWVIGSSILDLVGRKSFLIFYFSAGIIPGLLTLLFMSFTSEYARIAGVAPVLLALLTAWSMAFAEAEILLFFLIPVKAKWLVTGGVGAALLITLSNWELINLVLYLSAIVFGYCYSVIAWSWQSPFSVLMPIDRWLIKIGKRFGPKAIKIDASKDKILDIQTGRPPESDDAFVDSMLERIAKHGESSLSWKERQRLQQISQKKMKK